MDAAEVAEERHVPVPEHSTGATNLDVARDMIELGKYKPFAIRRNR
jgi:hypothetical protein